MIENNKALEKQISEQDKQIKKLIAVTMKLERMIMVSDKRIARLKHEQRNQRNMITSILNKGRG